MVPNLIASFQHLLIGMSILVGIFLLASPFAVSFQWKRFRAFLNFFSIVPFFVIYLFLLLQISDPNFMAFSFLVITTLIKIVFLPDFIGCKLLFGEWRLFWVYLLKNLEQKILFVLSSMMDLLFVIEVYLEDGIFYYIRTSLLRRLEYMDAFLHALVLFALMALVGFSLKYLLSRIAKSIA